MSGHCFTFYTIFPYEQVHIFHRADFTQTCLLLSLYSHSSTSVAPPQNSHVHQIPIIDDRLKRKKVEHSVNTLYSYKISRKSFCCFKVVRNCSLKQMSLTRVKWLLAPSVRIQKVTSSSRLPILP